MSNWKPISTAPKDGTVLLLYLREKPSCRRYVVPEEADHWTLGFWQGAWLSVETEDLGGMGSEYTGWMPDWQCTDIKPTYWMPLPKPPTD